MRPAKYDSVALYAEWKQGGYKSRQAFALAKGIPCTTINSIIKRMSKKLSPVAKVDKLGIDLAAKEIAARLVEAESRQAVLGKKMQERALVEVEGVEVRDAGQLSSLASAGVAIERKALGLRDDEVKDSKIVIQMAVGINLGGVDIAPVIEGKVVKEESV